MCPICHLHTYKPCACQDCDNFFCEKCIGIVKGSPQKICPTCKSNLKTRNLTRLEKEVFNDSITNGCPRQDCPEY